MNLPLHRNALVVQQALAAAGSRSEVRQLTDSARTSAEAAAALGVEVDQIGKSLVFLAGDRPVVVVACGGDRVDTAAVSAHFGGSPVTRPDARLVKDTTGFPIGGVSPVGLPAGVPVVIDRGLARFTDIWVAAGHPHAVFRTGFEELVRLSRATVGDFREDAGSAPQAAPSPR